MKEITNILRKSNMTPKDRVRILIQNSTSIQEHNKELLSQADIVALTDNWQPKNDKEVREYNRYIRLAKLQTSLYLDAKMFSLQSENHLLRIQGLLDYVSIDPITHSTFFKDEFDEFKTGALEYILNNSHMSYSQILQSKIFHSLSKDVQDDLLLLDETISYDGSYINDHVLLYESYKDNDILSDSQKRILFEHIYTRIQNTTKEDEFIRHSFFAELTTEIIVCRCADYLKITYDKNDTKFWDNLNIDIKKHASQRGVTVKDLLREIIYTWIDDGLFQNECIPLFKSRSFETWTKPTKKNHGELFFLWYEQRQKTKEYLDTLCDQENLIQQNQQITGSSLYYSESQEDFVLLFKKYIQTLIEPTILLLHTQKYLQPNKKYQTLKKFTELSQKISEIFDIKISTGFIEYQESYSNQVLCLNIKFARLIDDFYEHLYTNKENKYHIEIEHNILHIDVNTECEPMDIVNEYEKELDNN